MVAPANDSYSCRRTATAATRQSMATRSGVNISAGRWIENSKLVRGTSDYTNWSGSFITYTVYSLEDGSILPAAPAPRNPKWVGRQAAIVQVLLRRNVDR